MGWIIFLLPIVSKKGMVSVGMGLYGLVHIGMYTILTTILNTILITILNTILITILTTTLTTILNPIITITLNGINQHGKLMQSYRIIYSTSFLDYLYIIGVICEGNLFSNNCAL